MMIRAIPIFLALLIGFEPFAPRFPSRPIDASSCLLQSALGLLGAASVAIACGLGITAFRRVGHSLAVGRKLFRGASCLVVAVDLAVFAWMTHDLEWIAFVRSELGLRAVPLLDDLLILLPFLVSEVFGWWALYPAARALRLTRETSSIEYLWRIFRPSYGLFLPMVIVLLASKDLARMVFGDSARTPLVQVGTMAFAWGVLWLASPRLIRLALPSTPLPRGDLRDRLERLARRFGVRYGDILVLRTDDRVVNAFVTMGPPWSRHVVVSDGLLALLDEYEVAAVFGHEIGHVVHHHRPYLAALVIGSLGALLVLLQLAAGGAGSTGGGATAFYARQLAALGFFGVYLWLVFGAVSRRLERQADVFACRAVSCGRPDCPPHGDYFGKEGESTSTETPLCPTGIRIYVNALETVGERHHVEPDARSWRHGSFRRRVEFLQGLQGRPAAERRFQLGVVRLRWITALMLASVLVLAWLGGVFDSLPGV